MLIGDSIAHNANFRDVEWFTNSTLKTSKAYSSVWDKDARFKHLNVTDVAKNELGKAHFDHLVLAAPTVDISNMDTSNVKPEDSTEELKQKIELSCHNMLLRVLLTITLGWEKWAIMNHANSFLLELWLDSPKE